MKLLEPNPGEALDRQAVCFVKAEFAEKSLKDPNIPPETQEERIPGQFKVKDRFDPKPWAEEAEALQRYMQNNWFPLIARNEKELAPKLDEFIDDLYKINKQIYTLNVQLRIYKTVYSHPSSEVEPPRTVQALAFQLIDLNDARANLVFNVNRLFGCTVVEKMYV